MNKDVYWIILIVLAVIALAIIAGLLHFIFANIGYILLLAALIGGGYYYFKKKNGK